MALVKTDVSEVAAANQFYAVSNESADFMSCNSPERLTELLGKVSPGKHIHFETNGDWSMHDLVLGLLKKLQPVELHIATYAIRENPVRQIIMAMDRKEITALHMLVDNRVKTQAADAYHLIKSNANTFSSGLVHGKATVLKGANGCVSVIGSQNWTGNPRKEFGVITMDSGVADFYINCIKNGIENGKEFE